MKKLVLVLLVAMLSVPAFAAPAIDLVDLGSRSVALDYTTDGNLISGLGVKITVTGGTVATFTNGATKYWVHPENIVIVDGALSQLGSPVYEGNAVGLAEFTVEYGALYDRSDALDPNKPAANGRLCTFTVSGTGNYSVVATSNTIQGGVVTEDLTAYTALTDTLSVTAVAPAPTVTAITVNNANPGTTATFTNIAGTNFVTGATVKLTKAGKADIAVTSAFVSATQLTGSVALPLLTQQGTWNVVVTNPDAQTATLADAFTVNDCFAQGAVGSAQRTAYTKWVDYGRPSCWCFKKQCRGDADGALYLNKPVHNPDLTIFKDAYNKDKATIKLVANRICADFDKLDYLNKPVHNPDLVIFKNYYNDLATAVPQCDAAPVPTNNAVSFWTN